MSNVAPQFHSLNDGQWGDLEEWIAGRKPPNATAQNFIRGWADEFEEVWVVVGPLFEEERDPLDSGIPVPSGFFCIVVDEQDNGQPRALAFIMPHVDQRVDDLAGFLTTVDEIERRIAVGRQLRKDRRLRASGFRPAAGVGDQRGVSVEIADSGVDLCQC